MKLSLSGLDVSYDCLGERENPPLLFLHGWGGSRASLLEYAKLMSEKWYCIIPDLPGFGGTTKLAPGTGIDGYVTFIHTFTEQLEIQTPFAIIGHSFGGAVSLGIAASYPQAVQKIILCAPSWHRKRVGENTTKPSLLSRTPALRALIYRVFFPHSDLLRHPHLEATFKRIMTEDLAGILPMVKAPVLILWGDQDRYVPVSDGKLLQSRLAMAQLKIFPGMGHDLPIKHADLIVELSRQFLS